MNLYVWVVGLLMMAGSSFHPGRKLETRRHTAASPVAEIWTQSDSLFPGLRIRSLRWEGKDRFHFHTTLARYQGYTVYLLERDAKGYVTRLVLKHASQGFLGIECKMLPCQMVTAATELDLKKESGTFRRKDMPLTESYFYGDRVLPNWFLRTLCTGLDLLKDRNYRQTVPKLGGTVFGLKVSACMASTGVESAECAEKEASGDITCKGGGLVEGGITAYHSYGYSSVLTYRCKGS